MQIFKHMGSIFGGYIHIFGNFYIDNLTIIISASKLLCEHVIGSIQYKLNSKTKNLLTKNDK